MPNKINQNQFSFKHYKEHFLNWKNTIGPWLLQKTKLLKWFKYQEKTLACSIIIEKFTYFRSEFFFGLKCCENQGLSVQGLLPLFLSLLFRRRQESFGNEQNQQRESYLSRTCEKVFFQKWKSLLFLEHNVASNTVL